MLNFLLDLQSRDALDNEQMKRTAKRYRKPLREMLRQHHRHEAVKIGAKKCP
jgi:hypothetical protein